MNRVVTRESFLQFQDLWEILLICEFLLPRFLLIHHLFNLSCVVLQARFFLHKDGRTKHTPQGKSSLGIFSLSHRLCQPVTTRFYRIQTLYSTNSPSSLSVSHRDEPDNQYPNGFLCCRIRHTRDVPQGHRSQKTCSIPSGSLFSLLFYQHF